MKQINSVIASALVSGLIVLGMVGIGVNAMTSTGVPANTAPASVTINSSVRTARRFGQTDARRTSGTTDSGPVQGTH